jgi:hypothetical protein
MNFGLNRAANNPSLSTWRRENLDPQHLLNRIVSVRLQVNNKNSEPNVYIVDDNGIQMVSRAIGVMPKNRKKFLEICFMGKIFLVREKIWNDPIKGLKMIKRRLHEQKKQNWQQCGFSQGDD